MPREIPDSNSDTERLMLKVTMHWYGFQMFTMRLVSVSGVSTFSTDSDDAQDSRSRLNPSATVGRAAASGR